MSKDSTFKIYDLKSWIPKTYFLTKTCFSSITVYILHIMYMRKYSASFYSETDMSVTWTVVNKQSPHYLSCGCSHSHHMVISCIWSNQISVFKFMYNIITHKCPKYKRRVVLMSFPRVLQLIQKEALKMVQTIMWRLLSFYLPSVLWGEGSSASAAICRTSTHLPQKSSNEYSPCCKDFADQPYMW